MGWSATAAACDTMDKLYDYCRAQGGSCNSWGYKDSEYFTERGKEFADGHISMTIWKVTQTFNLRKEYQSLCSRAGSIYINPDGTIRCMPKYLRNRLDL